MSSIGGSSIQGVAGGLVDGMAGSSELGKEEFLMLLVVQLQNQDPLEPMDDKEFIAQLAQFTALEQQMNMTASMDELVQVQLEQQMISAASYIGREVTARGSGVYVESTGDAADEIRVTKLQYAVSEEMVTGYVNIYDSNDQIVRTYTLDPKAPGLHDLNWDGKRTNGNKAADGVYTVRISGKNAAGEPIMIDASVAGLVDGITQIDNQQVLRLNDGRLVSLANVFEVLAYKEEIPDPDEDKGEGEGEGEGGDDDDKVEGGDKDKDDDKNDGKDEKTTKKSSSPTTQSTTTSPPSTQPAGTTPQGAAAQNGPQNGPPQAKSMVAPIQEQIEVARAKAEASRTSVSQLFKSRY